MTTLFLVHGRVVTYPTGYKARRWQYVSPKGRVHIEIEQVIKLPPLSISGMVPGDYEVSGSIIPRGATGAICHESLPIYAFQARRYGADGAKRRALAKAEELFNHYLPQCEGSKACD